MNIPLLVHRIIEGKLFFDYKNSSLYYLQPNNSIKYRSELLYDKIIQDNLYEPWTRKEDVPRILKYLDLWTDDDEKFLEQNMKKIDQLKLAIYNSRLNKQQLDQNRRSLHSTKNTIQTLLNKKNSLNYITLEEYASIKKNEYVFLHSIFDTVTDKTYFSTDANEVDHMQFDNIVTKISEHFISIEDYKTLARSEHWKAIWHGNKYNVFDRASCSLTEEQKSLINVSIMYDRIYEHPECPEESVIEDDDMLDGWMIYQKQKIENSKKESNAQNFASKHGNAQEIFVVGNREDVDTIYAMNSSEGKNIIKQRVKAISKSTEGIDEANLPDVQRDLLSKVNRVKR